MLLVASHSYEVARTSDGLKTDAALLLGGPFLPSLMHLVQANCSRTRKYTGRLHLCTRAVLWVCAICFRLRWVCV